MRRSPPEVQHLRLVRDNVLTCLNVVRAVVLYGFRELERIRLTERRATRRRGKRRIARTLLPLAPVFVAACGRILA